MHIAFLMQDTGTIYGAERATLDLAARLQAAPDMRVTVYLMEELRLGLNRSEIREALDRKGIPAARLPVRHAFCPKLIKLLRAALRRDGVDILHTVGYKADLHGGWAAGFGKVAPAVATVHGWLFRPDIKERFYARVNVWVLRRFQRVIVLSRYYEELLQKEGIPSRVLVRIPSGYPAPSEIESKPRSGPFTVGILGRLSWEKNHDLFLSVAQALQGTEAPIRFLIAGTGPEEQRIALAIQRLGLSDSIAMRGYMLAPDFFEEIDALAVCSRIESLPYSLLEAMAYGVPIVATRVGGIPDLVEDGVNGFLVESDDASAMAQRLLDLATDTDRVERFVRAGGEKLRADFGEERQRDGHRAVYQALTQQAGG